MVKKQTDTDADTDADTDTGDGVQVTMSQGDLDKLFQDRARTAGAAAEKKIADDLGVPVEEAKRIIAAARDAAERDKTAAQRAAEAETAAAATKAAAEAAVKAAEARATATVELAEAGVTAGTIPTVLRLIDVSSETPIKDQIEKLRKDVPGLFAASAGEQPGVKPTGSKSGTAGGKKDPRRAARQQLERVYGPRYKPTE